MQPPPSPRGLLLVKPHCLTPKASPITGAGSLTGQERFPGALQFDMPPSELPIYTEATRTRGLVTRTHSPTEINAWKTRLSRETMSSEVSRPLFTAFQVLQENDASVAARMLTSKTRASCCSGTVWCAAQSRGNLTVVNLGVKEKERVIICTQRI